MSSGTFAAPLRIELRASRRLRHWTWLVHALAALSLTLLQSPLLMLSGAVLVFLNLLRTPPPTPRVLLWRSDGHWELDVAGQHLSGELARTAFVQPWLVILPLRCRQRRRWLHLCIVPDMLPAESFRRLRVRLRTTAPLAARAHRVT